MVTGKKCSSALKVGKSMQCQAKLSAIETLMSLDSRARPKKKLGSALSGYSKLTEPRDMAAP
jgi:hypothetical protein